MADENKKEFWRWTESNWKNPDTDWTAAQYITIGIDVGSVSSQAVIMAAASIDRTLGGSGNIDEVLFPRSNPDPFLGRDEGFASFPRKMYRNLMLKPGSRVFRKLPSDTLPRQPLKKPHAVCSVICGCI